MMLMEIEPKEEAPWLSQVEIWNKKKEFERDEKERVEIEIKKAEMERIGREKEEELEREREREREREKLEQWKIQVMRNKEAAPPIHVQYFINNNIVPVAPAAEESQFTNPLLTNSSFIDQDGGDIMQGNQKIDQQSKMNPSVSNLDSQSPSLPIPCFQSTQSRWTITSIFYAIILLLCLSSLLFLSYHILLSLHKDISYKLEEQYTLLNSHILQCANDWHVNGCGDVAKSIPHMSQFCQSWQECMHQDPENINRLVVLASILSSVINSLIDPLSWKSVLVGTIWFFVSCGVGIYGLKMCYKS